MLIIKKLNPYREYFYHEFSEYYGDPADDSTWEPGESYYYDDEEEDYVREMIPLPYKPIFFMTDEEWLKQRILAYADENPLMCDIENRKQVEGKIFPYSKIMCASIPRGMAFLLKED